MTVSSLWRIVALNCVITAVHAQSATTPSQSFTAGSPTCSNGLAVPSTLGGAYTDSYGTLWDVECGQDNTGNTYDPVTPSYTSANGPGTNGAGMLACFIGCDRRMNCTGFAFTGSVSSSTTGSGHCYYKNTLGSYYLNSSNYATANMIQGSPQLPVRLNLGLGLHLQIC